MASFTASVKLLFHDSFSSGVNRARQSFSAMSETMAGISERGQQLSQFAANLSLMSANVGQLAAKMNETLRMPTEMASQFETGLARVSTVLNETNAVATDVPATQMMIAESAMRMAGGLNDAGKIAALSADTYANSVYTMLSSGLTAQQATAATEQAALLAKATGGTMDDASAMLVGVFNNMGNKSAEAGAEMQRLSDIMVGTQNYFAFENLQQLSDGFKNASGVAISFGLPLEQLSATLGQLNTNMITGGEAGTAVKSVLAQMGNASRKLGFDIAETADGGIDLVATLDNIMAVGATGAELTKAFGSEAGPAVGILTANLSELKAGYASVGDAAGVTLQNASKVADTFAESIRKLKVSQQALAAKVGVGSTAVAGWGVSVKMAATQAMLWVSEIPGIGSALASTAGGVMQFTSTLISGVSGVFQFTSGVASMMVMIQQAGGITRLFTQSFGLLRSAVGLLTAPFKIAVKGIFSLARSFITALPSMGAWIASTWSLAAAHLAAYWPIYVVIAAVAAVATAAVAIIKYWQPISGFFVRIWGGIKDSISKVWNWFLGILDNPVIRTIGLIFAPFITVPTLIIKHWQPIKAFFSTLWDGILAGWEKISGIFSKIGSFFGFGGEKLTTTMADGMTQGTTNLTSVTADTMSAVDDYLPHSNARKGPLSQLTASGAAIPQTLAKGFVADKSLEIASVRQATQVRSRIIPSLGGVELRQSKKETAAAPVYNITINDMSVQAADLESLLALLRGLVKEAA